jgi:hypothetical protein
VITYEGVSYVCRIIHTYETYDLQPVPTYSTYLAYMYASPAPPLCEWKMASHGYTF